MATIPGTLNTNLTDEQVLEAFDNALTHTPSDSTPKEDGSGSAGEAETFARSDHEHPHDTTKQDTLAFEGTYNASTNKVTTMSAVKDGKLAGYAQTSGNVTATDKIIEAIGKVEKKADDNKTNISSLQGTAVSQSFSASTAGVYEYTGISITVPANEVYEIIATDRFSTNAPQGVIIASTNQVSVLNNNDAVIIAENAEPLSTNTNMRTRTAIGVTPKLTIDTTYYVWVKRSGATANTVYAWYRKLF